jgi:aryl-alcohol dehydrogenase-like predicted oxidoreductase
MSRIGLGTVQFAMDYGISNRDGRPSEAEVAAILGRAVEAGVGYLDTAASYDEAEMLIGRHLPPGHGLRIVTKLPPIAEDVIAAPCAKTMLAALAASLERLRSTQVYGVLIHQTRDLTKPGWQYLIEALREAQVRGWALRIGVSVYDARDLAMLENRFTPDLVQLPFNALDRRLAVSGCLHRLKAAGVEVHARSLFLQGLLLMEPAALPEFFGPLRERLSSLHASWAAAKLTPLAGCLRCVLRNAEIDAAIVGVNRRHELDQIEAAVVELADDDDEFELPSAIDPLYLDPRRWPATMQ